jgi:hypothetical protein
MTRAFHFLKEDMTSGYGNEPPWTVGERRELPKGQRVKMCARGYHSSPSFLDALSYAPGPVACIVEVGRVTRDTDKQVGRWRRGERFPQRRARPLLASILRCTVKEIEAAHASYRNGDDN